MGTVESSSSLRSELEQRIRDGQCVYCRAQAEPDRPLTREHVIPQAKGGRRKDPRIIVPACARCNHLRGCQELVLFLLLRPRRISAFLDYLGTLPPESIRQMDLRVFAELFTVAWILSESAEWGVRWRARLRHLSSGRTLHRRRYAARRALGSAGNRLVQVRRRGTGGPSCLLPVAAAGLPELGLEEPPERIQARLLALLALAWQVPAEEVQGELARALERASGRGGEPTGALEGAEEGVLCLDGWKRGRQRRRVRVDRRRGRAAAGRGYRQPRGRAA